MDREKAIDYLRWIRPKNPYTMDRKNVQAAIDMAIESLSKLTCLECKGCGFCDTCQHERML